MQKQTGVHKAAKQERQIDKWPGQSQKSLAKVRRCRASQPAGRWDRADFRSFGNELKKKNKRKHKKKKEKRKNRKRKKKKKKTRKKLKLKKETKKNLKKRNRKK